MSCQPLYYNAFLIAITQYSFVAATIPLWCSLGTDSSLSLCMHSTIDANEATTNAAGLGARKAR